MTLLLAATLLPMARLWVWKGVRVLLTGGATWTAASGGFAEAPSRSQLAAAVAAVLFAIGVVITEPVAKGQLASPKKVTGQVGPTWLRTVVQALAGGQVAFKKPLKVRCGM
ncbi:hypothetical protein [Micromonospora tulbaghiae]|uniref:hypothetical protein n=1 Tax=Micromonospora tulbaghiae TaxID=479978 RepID=UPI0036BDA75D